MRTIEYPAFNTIDPNDFLPLLNSKKIRQHLVEHELFTIETLTAWMKGKVQVDAAPGCKVRGIICDGELAGWCGIQLDEGRYELAIIIDDKFWGLGKRVFKELMVWAKALQHDEVCIHFLHTRPEYQFLKKMAKNTYKAEFFGSQFTIYQLAVK